jgi:hypothetical protein
MGCIDWMILLEIGISGGLLHHWRFAYTAPIGVVVCYALRMPPLLCFISVSCCRNYSSTRACTFTGLFD